MERLILVDSGIFIHFLRKRQDPVVRLRERFESLDMATCGVVQAEVLRGMRHPRARDKMAAFFSVLINVPTDNRLWEEGWRRAWELDRSGHILPLQDILIATCAQKIGAEVLTLDRHFAMIPDLRLTAIPEGWL